MHRLPKLVHYVICDVRNVVDRPLAYRLKPVNQPLWRRTDLYVPDNARCKTMAKIGIFDRYDLTGEDRW